MNDLNRPHSLAFNLPVFLCDSHQSIFWAELKNIPLVNYLEHDQVTCTISINLPLNKETLNRLNYLFSYWHIDQNILQLLSTPVNK